jgi:hypothetical protein
MILIYSTIDFLLFLLLSLCELFVGMRSKFATTVELMQFSSKKMIMVKLHLIRRILRAFKGRGELAQFGFDGWKSRRIECSYEMVGRDAKHSVGIAIEHNHIIGRR